MDSNELNEDTRVGVLLDGDDAGIPVAEAMSVALAERLLRQVADRLAALPADPQEWATAVASVANQMRGTVDMLTASAGAVGVLNGVSVRRIGELAGVRHDTVRRHLARSVTLGSHAEGEGVRRAVSTSGIDEARRQMSAGDVPTIQWVTPRSLPVAVPVRWEPTLNGFVIAGVGRPDAE